MQAPLPPDEDERLKALRQYDVLDTAAEQAFDDLTHLAAQICAAPLSAITLIDRDRQWFKSSIGLDVSETPRDISFCAHTILGQDMLLVPDTAADERFAANPLVAGAPHIRFYAGVPLLTPEGHAVGALCVLDTVPRQLNQGQQDALARLARQTVALLEARPGAAAAKGQSRRARLQSENERVVLAADTARRDTDNLEFSETRYRRLFETAQDGILILDAETGKIEDVNPYLCELLGYAPDDFISRQLWEIGAFRDIVANKDALRALQDKGYIRYDELPLVTKEGQSIPVEFVSNVYDCASKAVIQCNIRDISESKRAAATKLSSERFLQSALDALTSQLAVLSEAGDVIAINNVWKQFSEENEGTSASCGIGDNYLDVCGKSRGSWAAKAPSLIQGIREVIAGRQRVFCMEYPCHSAGEERWFNTCVTRFAGEGPVCVVIEHENITERTLAAKALRESETRYRALAEAAPDDIFILDREGILRYVNQHAARRFGFPPETLLGRSQVELFPGVTDKNLPRGVVHVFETGEPLYEETHLTFHQQDTWQGIWLVPLRDAAGEVHEVMGVARDISGQKHAEATLRESEARYRALFESNPQPMWVYDRETLEFLAVNDAAITHYGYSGDEFLAMTIKNIRPPEDIPLVLTRVATNADFTSPDGKRNMWRHRKKDGTIIDVEISTHELSFAERPARLVLAQDITARRVAEQALFEANDELELRVTERTTELAQANQSLRLENIQHQATMITLRHTADALQQAKEETESANEELRAEIAERHRAVEAQQQSYALMNAVAEGTTDCIFVKDLQGRYLMINSVGAKRRRMTPEEVLGKIDTELFSPETAHLIMEADHRILASDSTQTFEETTVEDGVIRTHLTTKGPHRNARGEVVGIVGISRDITARKMQEETLRVAKEEADLANAAKSEFLSRMSHELRTPLNAILGFGQILARQELNALSEESVGYILTGGRHLLDLINEVLDISRVEAGHLEFTLEPVALQHVVPEACALVRPLAAARSISVIEKSEQPSRSHILADRQRFQQVLINLLSNAIKYNNEGGTVEVSCVPKPGARIAIQVRDTGRGITPEDMLKLFTPFERLNASNTDIEGTGLGLALSQRLVTAMGGTLYAESTPGQGTVFTVELPDASSPGEQPANSSEDNDSPGNSHATGHSYCVLCIEDNPSNLRLLEAIFETRPEIEMLAAMQGGSGLELALRHEPDLILLDLNLPDINGGEVLARLQQSAITKDIPVIVVSADATPDQIERLLAAGARAYLTKPLNIKQFLLTLDQFLHTVVPAAHHS